MQLFMTEQPFWPVFHNKENNESRIQSTWYKCSPKKKSLRRQLVAKKRISRHSQMVHVFFTCRFSKKRCLLLSTCSGKKSGFNAHLLASEGGKRATCGSVAPDCRPEIWEVNKKRLRKANRLKTRWAS